LLIEAPLDAVACCWQRRWWAVPSRCSCSGCTGTVRIGQMLNHGILR
jgi:hypothetical protein